MLLSAMLLTRSCFMELQRLGFNWYDELNYRFAEHDIAGITARICTILENFGSINQIDHFYVLVRL